MFNFCFLLVFSCNCLFDELNVRKFKEKRKIMQFFYPNDVFFVFLQYIIGMIMMRSLLYLVAFVLALCSCSEGRDARTERAAREAVDTVPMLVMQIQKQSRLYTAEYRIHKIVTHDDVLRLKGSVMSRQFDVRLPLGDRKIAFGMDASLKAFIDFSDFSERNVERRGDRITIVLPDPKVVVTGTRIDHKSVKEFVAVTRSRFTDAELADFERQGRESIVASIPNLDIIETAKENAARVLVPMITQMGYSEENVTIAFRKQLTARDITVLSGETSEKR